MCSAKQHFRRTPMKWAMDVFNHSAVDLILRPLSNLLSAYTELLPCISFPMCFQKWP